MLLQKLDSQGRFPAAEKLMTEDPGVRRAWTYLGPGGEVEQRNRQEPLDARSTLTPNAFIAKTHASELKERPAAQEHVIDLCRLLRPPPPAVVASNGDRYCLERGSLKHSGGGGWRDVWKLHCFAWEYKGKHANLDADRVRLVAAVPTRTGEPASADQLGHGAVQDPEELDYGISDPLSSVPQVAQAIATADSRSLASTVQGGCPRPDPSRGVPSGAAIAARDLC